MTYVYYFLSAAMGLVVISIADQFGMPPFTVAVLFFGSVAPWFLLFFIALRNEARQ